MYIIAGLGNPTRKYELSRHNAGYMSVDAVASRLGADNFKEDKKFDALISQASFNGEKILLVKPLTYMNNSGDAIAPLVHYFDVEPEKLILIYDDIEFDFGVVKIRAGGGPGTHNGMKSVISALGFDNFPRIRVGIGPKPEYMELYEYVLSNFNFIQRDEFNDIIENICDIILEIIKNGIDIAMNKYNPKRSVKNEKPEENTKTETNGE